MSKNEPLEIKVLVLKNKETGKIVRLLPVSYMVQMWRYPAEKWECIRTEKVTTEGVFK